MPIPSDFEAECLYDRSAWYMHDVLEIDMEQQRVVIELDTNDLGPLVAAQRQVGGHELHLPGAVMVQMTATLGNLHAVYVLGLRPTEGWHGYGTKIVGARFNSMGRIGPPVIATATATRARQVRGTWFIDYTFEYTQEGEIVYASEQSSVWLRQKAPVTS